MNIHEYIDIICAIALTIGVIFLGIVLVAFVKDVFDY